MFRFTQRFTHAKDLIRTSRIQRTQKVISRCKEPFLNTKPYHYCHVQLEDLKINNIDLLSVPKNGFFLGETYFAQSDIQGIVKYLDRMVSTNLMTDSEVIKAYKVAHTGIQDKELYKRILYRLTDRGQNFDASIVFWDYVKFLGNEKPEYHVFIMMARGCERSIFNLVDMAILVLEYALQFQYKLEASIFRCVLRTCNRHNDLVSMLRLYDMMPKLNIPEDMLCNTICMEGLQDHPNLAKEYFYRFNKRQVELFMIYMDTMMTHGEIEEVIKAFGIFLKSKLFPEDEFVVFLTKIALKLNHPELTRLIIDATLLQWSQFIQFRKRIIKPLFTTASTLSEDYVESVVKTIKSKNIMLDKEIHGYMALSFAQLGSLSKVKDIFYKSLDKGLYSRSTAQALFMCCRDHKDVELAWSVYKTIKERKLKIKPDNVYELKELMESDYTQKNFPSYYQEYLNSPVTKIIRHQKDTYEEVVLEGHNTMITVRRRIKKEPIKSQ